MSSENNNDNDGEGAPSRLARMSEEEIVKAKGDAVRLARLYEEYSCPRNFKPGDFVRFHPSMRNRPNPNEHVLGIVTRVLSCPFYEDFKYNIFIRIQTFLIVSFIKRVNLCTRCNRHSRRLAIATRSI